MKTKLEKLVLLVSEIWSDQQSFGSPRNEQEIDEVLTLLTIAENLLNDIGENL